MRGLEARAVIDVIPNVVSIRIALSQVGAVTSGPPERNTMATTLTNRLADIGGLTDAERTSLAARTVTALADGVYPAYKRLSDALNRLQPDSTIEAGVWELPDGDAYYDWVLRHHLSIDISPEEVHEAGLREVGRVRREIGDWLESHGYARADEGFAAALRRAVADTESITIADDADRAGLLQRHTELVETLTLATAHVFGLVPAAPVEIVRPPPHREAPFAAYYRQPPLRGDRPGIFYLSMGGGSAPSHRIATTVAHEAVPGHHFQLALQAESDVPLHQRAFVFSGLGAVRRAPGRRVGSLRERPGE